MQFIKKLFVAGVLITTVATAQKTIKITYPDSIYPKGFHQIDLDKNFSNANKGTVDLFSSRIKGALALGIPKNYVGLQDSIGSSNYFGLITYNSANVCEMKGFKKVCEAKENYAEYLQIQLPEPCQAGRSYEVSFFVSLADYSGFATSGWGLLFNENATKEADENRLNIEPSVSIEGMVTNIKDWTELKGVYTAKGGEKFLTIGVFAKNFKQQPVAEYKYSKSFATTKAYYYLGNISLKEFEMDKDKDGIPDNQDKCPDVFGVAQFNGCPDTDGDGIQDSEDKCPTVKGIAQFNGCPDTDGDGIQDSEDACPQVAGKKEAKGCPDTDGDGIADNDDRCPNIAGPISNNGCPEVAIDNKAKQIFQQAMTGIQFETGKDVIKKTSYGILDNVVSVLKSNPTWDTEVEGHTDNVGNAEANKELSQKRANAVMKYLQDKGVVNKLSARGFGMERPIADNKTAKGKAKNRRVEFKVTYQQ
jgi:outer membrane protein OmpA-like peptidoglycan-associated protein